MPMCNVKSIIDAQVSFTAENDSDNPSEYFIDNMELDALWMFGDEWTEKELRLIFGDQGADAMLQLIFNRVEEGDWDYE